MIVTPCKLPSYHYDDTFYLSLIKRDLRELNSKEQEKFLDDYPYIGPHEGKSLSLILLGKKALYIGARDYIRGIKTLY